MLHQRVLLLGRRCLGAAADNAPALLLRAHTAAKDLTGSLASLLCVAGGEATAGEEGTGGEQELAAAAARGFSLLLRDDGGDANAAGAGATVPPPACCWRATLLHKQRFLSYARPLLLSMAAKDPAAAVAAAAANGDADAGIIDGKVAAPRLRAVQALLGIVACAPLLLLLLLLPPALACRCALPPPPRPPLASGCAPHELTPTRAPSAPLSSKPPLSRAAPPCSPRHTAPVCASSHRASAPHCHCC